MVDHQVDLEVELAQEKVAKEEVEEEEDLLVDQERAVKVEQDQEEPLHLEQHLKQVGVEQEDQEVNVT